MPLHASERHRDPVLWQGMAALLLTLPLPFLSEYSGLDIWLEDIFFDTATGTFPWRQQAWFEALAHGGTRSLLVALLGINLLALVLAWLRPALLQRLLPPFWCQPRVLAYLLLASASGPALIGALKKITTHQCPWDMAMYGGESVYHRLLDAPLLNFSDPGKCFPGGHASGGFALLAIVPLLQGRQRLQAAAFALTLGMLMGWSRMMQGAHFLSHNLWSAWICWALVLGCYAILRPAQAMPVPSGYRSGLSQP